MDLSAGEIALYAFLIRMEDRKTYTCYPSFKTIGNALKMSRNTVMKYVRLLEEKELISTERTIVPSPKKQTKNAGEKPNEKNDKYGIKLLYCTAFTPRFT